MTAEFFSPLPLSIHLFFFHLSPFFPFSPLHVILWEAPATACVSTCLGMMLTVLQLALPNPQTTPISRFLSVSLFYHEVSFDLVGFVVFVSPASLRETRATSRPQQQWSSTSVCEWPLEWGCWSRRGSRTKAKLSSGPISLLGLSVVRLAQPDRMIDGFVRGPRVCPEPEALCLS